MHNPQSESAAVRADGSSAASRNSSAPRPVGHRAHDSVSRRLPEPGRRAGPRCPQPDLGARPLLRTAGLAGRARARLSPLCRRPAPAGRQRRKADRGARRPAAPARQADLSSHAGPSDMIAAASNSSGARRRPFPGIEDLAAELIALEAPLRALAGPEVRLEIECAPCAGRLALNSEDLLRILFNLVANAVEAMASTPAELRRRAFPAHHRPARRRGELSRSPRRSDARLDAQTVVLSVRDNGPGIAATHLPHIFDPGFSTRQAIGSRPGRSSRWRRQREAREAPAVWARDRPPAGRGGGRRGARGQPRRPRRALRHRASCPRPKGAQATHGSTAADAGHGEKKRFCNLQQISAQIEKEA